VEQGQAWALPQLHGAPVRQRGRIEPGLYGSGGGSAAVLVDRAGRADAVIFRSLDAGQSFQALGDDVLPERGMVMRFKADPESEGDFFAVTTDGSVIRTREMAESATLVGERLPRLRPGPHCRSRDASRGAAPGARFANPIRFGR